MDIVVGADRKRILGGTNALSASLPGANGSDSIAKGPRDRLWTAVVLVMVLVLLAGWLPHYLTWPWWPDLDAYATIAQGWDGRLPYRDVVMFNFPGQIELFWVLGKTLGWGRTAPIYAVDAGGLIVLGALLGGWSRRRFGASWPGLIGFVAALAYYEGLDYSLVAQRDWQGPLLAVLGLLTVQTWPGRAGRLASAPLLAAAFVIRPHVALFGPAMLLALDQDARRPGDSWKATALALAEWSAVFGTSLVLAFSPLWASGLMGDFVRGVRKASYGSNYNAATPRTVVRHLLDQLGLLRLGDAFTSVNDFWTCLGGWSVLLVILANGLLVGVARPTTRRPAIVWLVTLLTMLLYEPLHPKEHVYLAHPLRLVHAINLGVLAALLRERTADRPALRVALPLLLLVLAVPGLPAYWDLGRSLQAIGHLGRGQEPAEIPLGAVDDFAPGDRSSPYTWDDYRKALDYLRHATRPDTLVANVLRNVPFPAINGPTGRVSPLPAESGVIWLWSVEPELEGAFIAAIEEAPRGSVVVCDPERPSFDPRIQLDRLFEAMRRQYRREASFGVIEVWRKF